MTQTVKKHDYVYTDIVTYLEPPLYPHDSFAADTAVPMPREVTLSSHASRNPSKPVQPTRKRQSQASKASRALAAEQRDEKETELEAKFTEFFQLREETIADLAEQYDKSVDYIRKVLVNGTGYGGKRGVNLRNAISHDMALKAKEGE